MSARRSYKMWATRPTWIAMVAVLLVGTGLATYYSFVRWQDNRYDLYPRWIGVQAMFTEGLNPSSEEVALRSQMGIYGRPARVEKGESEHHFLYPAFIAFTIPHLWLPFPVAIPAWAVKRDQPPTFPTLGYALALTIPIILVTTPRIRSYDLAMATLPLGYLILVRFQPGRAAATIRGMSWIIILVVPWVLSSPMTLAELEAVERLIIGLACLILVAGSAALHRRRTRITGQGNEPWAQACTTVSSALQ